MSGPSWEQLKHTADGDLGQANIADQNSDHDVKTLAVALLYARTGKPPGRGPVTLQVLTRPLR